ncbi:MAG: hypothetical protein R3F49_14570 [Planctomycetota bacterium]
MDLLLELREKAQRLDRRIVLPESNDGACCARRRAWLPRGSAGRC